jgi:hypothetical protein
MRSTWLGIDREEEQGDILERASNCVMLLEWQEGGLLGKGDHLLFLYFPLAHSV